MAALADDVGGAASVTTTTTTPVHEELLIQIWTSWTTLFAVLGLASLFMLLDKVPHSAFRNYLLFLMFPDWLFNVGCILLAADSDGTDVSSSHLYGVWTLCQWQVWYSLWGIGTNAWLNAVLAFEVHTMLKGRRTHTPRQYVRDYQGPSNCSVLSKALMIYLVVAWTALWGTMELSSVDRDTANAGTCLPSALTREQTNVLWLVLVPVLVLLPYLYVVSVVGDIGRNNLLLPNGKHYVATMHLFHILVVFVLLWGCTAVSASLLLWKDWVPQDSGELALVYIVSVLAHVQVLGTVAAAATWNETELGKDNGEADNDDEMFPSSSRSGKSSMWFFWS